MSSKKEFVAFEGKKFVIEWYFDKRGTSRSLEYFESLNIFEQIKVLELFKLMANLGEIKNKTKFHFEGDKIYAFKPQPHRFLCFFFKGGKIIITNAFIKKTSKLPNAEKEKALRIKEEYEMRTEQGRYYD